MNYKKLAIIGATDEDIEANIIISQELQEYDIVCFKSIDDIPKEEFNNYEIIEKEIAETYIKLRNLALNSTGNSNYTPPKKKRKKNKKSRR